MAAALVPPPPTVLSKRLISEPLENNPIFYHVAYEGGGRIPFELNGMFTSKRFADEAIERFLRGANREQSNS